MTTSAILRRTCIAALCIAAVGAGVVGCAGPGSQELTWTSAAKPRTAVWVVDPATWEHHKDHATDSKDFTITEYRSTSPETRSCRLVTSSNKLPETAQAESDFASTGASFITGGRLPTFKHTTVAVSGPDRAYKTVQVMALPPSKPERGTVFRAFVSADRILGVTAECDTPDEVRRALSPEAATVSIELTD